MNTYLKYDEFVKKHCIEHRVMNGMRIGDRGYRIFGKSRPENGGILMSKLDKLKGRKELTEFDKEYIKRIMNYNKSDEEEMKERDEPDHDAFADALFEEESTYSRFAFDIFEPQTVVPSANRFDKFLFGEKEEEIKKVKEEEKPKEVVIDIPDVTIAESSRERKNRLERERVAKKVGSDKEEYDRRNRESTARTRSKAKAKDLDVVVDIEPPTPIVKDAE